MHVHVHLIPRGPEDRGDNADKMIENKVDLSDSEIDSLYNQLKIT